MANSKISQLQHESDTWKRSLFFLSGENVHLKTRLSEILKGDTDKRTLETAEIFQNNFIAEDELIRLLRGDISAFDKLIVREVSEDGAILDELMQKLKTIRINMSNAETRFSKLKLDFNRYFLDCTSKIDKSV